MILHKHKAIFIHVPKTGGTSIENFFGRVWDPEISKIEDYSIMLGPSLNHCFYDKILEHHPQAPTYFSFSFVRNPWARAVSHYRWFKLWRDEIKKISFKEFLILISNSDFEYKHHVRPQSDFIVDSDGNQILDFVGRFESLQEDFNHVCGKLGLKDSRLSHVNKSGNLSVYHDFYDKESKLLVAKKYAEDIERFKYTFE